MALIYSPIIFSILFHTRVFIIYHEKLKKKTKRGGEKTPLKYILTAIHIKGVNFENHIIGGLCARESILR